MLFTAAIFSLQYKLDIDWESTFSARRTLDAGTSLVDDLDIEWQIRIIRKRPPLLGMIIRTYIHIRIARL